MDYTSKIEHVRALVDELRHIKDALCQIEETVCAIEKEVGEVDNSLPTDDELMVMQDSREKEQILHLIDLNAQAYGLVDDILGPAEDDQPAAFSPEARGNSNISLEDALAQMLPSGGKHSAS